jgi:hypothetical protein
MAFGPGGGLSGVTGTSFFGRTGSVQSGAGHAPPDASCSRALFDGGGGSGTAVIVGGSFVLRIGAGSGGTLAIVAAIIAAMARRRLFVGGWSDFGSGDFDGRTGSVHVGGSNDPPASS